MEESKTCRKAGGAVGHLCKFIAVLRFAETRCSKTSENYCNCKLAYFIAPIDAIPDFVAGIGYTDDLGALMAALLQASLYVDDDVKDKARVKLAEWFGSDIDTSFIDQKLDQ